jgi:general secretion pathway protein G
MVTTQMDGRSTPRLSVRRSALRCGLGSQAGWTLVEMLVVISLVVILASIAMASYGTGVIRSKEAVLKEDLFRMRDGIDQFYADRGQYPPELQSLVGEGYLRSVPVDPFTRSNATWQTVASEFDPTDPTALPGVFDVRSGATGQAIDGTVYADW